jgi:hypothetical protein
MGSVIGDEESKSSSHIWNSASNYLNNGKFNYFFCTIRNLNVIDEKLSLNLLITILHLMIITHFLRNNKIAYLQ